MLNLLFHLISIEYLFRFFSQYCLQKFSIFLGFYKKKLKFFLIDGNNSFAFNLLLMLLLVEKSSVFEKANIKKDLIIASNFFNTKMTFTLWIKVIAF